VTDQYQVMEIASSKDFVCKSQILIFSMFIDFEPV